MTTLTEFLARLDEPRPFNWATNNCCSFAASWVELRTGKNPMAGLAATPDALSAMRLVKSMGGTLAAAWSKALNQEPILPTLAQVGDVVLVPTEGVTGAAAGICVGSQAMFIDESGTGVFMPLSACTYAWRIA